MSENIYTTILRREALLMSRLLSVIAEMYPEIIDKALNSKYINDNQRSDLQECQEQWGF